jgi:hypothetical protein
MKQNVVKEQHRRETQTKISSFFKHGLNNTKYVACQNCFLRLMFKLTFLHFMTSKFVL